MRFFLRSIISIRDYQLLVVLNMGSTVKYFEKNASQLPPEKGNYVLLFEIKKQVLVTIGSLGKQTFPVGHYVYVGSALGSGGIRARLSHHLKPSPKPHWHIDYLKPHINWLMVGWLVTCERLECVWTHKLIKDGASAPICRFGASDCKQKCPSHLLLLNLNQEKVFKNLGIQDFLAINLIDFE